MSLSLSIILGVVPDDTSEWNPEIAPHMTQMKTNGNRLPLNVGPPERNVSLIGGGCEGGVGRITPSTSKGGGASFLKLDRETRGGGRRHKGGPAAMEAETDRAMPAY